MEALCRIKLLEPYRNEPDRIIPIGNGQQSLLPMGAGMNISVTDPAFHVGFNKEQLGNEEDQNRFRAGVDIVYELKYDKVGIIIPVSCAMTHFGDWTIKPGDRKQRGIKRTYQQEKVRVAMQWGDYARMPRGKVTQQGKVEADTRIIGIPDVPHVSIQVIEQNGNPYGEVFDPWTFFKWDRDVDKNALREAQAIARELGMYAPQPIAPQIAGTEFDLSKLTPDQLEQIAAMLEKRAKKKPRGSGTHEGE